MTINPYSFLTLTTSLLPLSLGLFTYLKNRSSRIHRLFFALCMSVFIWPVSLSILLNLTDPHAILFWTKLGHSACTIAPAIYFDFVITLTEKHRWRLASHSYYLLVVGILAFMWTGQGYFPGDIHWYRWGPYAAAGPLVSLDAAMAALVVAVSWWFLFREGPRIHRMRTAQEFNQFRYLRAALMIFALAVIDYIPKYGVPVFPLGSVFVAIFAIIVTYAIVRHQLLDINVAIQRTVVYSLLAALITSLYFSMVLGVEKVLQDVMGYRSLIGSLMAGFAIALCFNPVKDRVQCIVDRLFFRGTQASLAAENEQLRHELARTERLRSVATLAAGMAHEIKNPLSSIKTFAEYLPERYDDPAYREKFTRIVSQEVDKMNMLIQRLLEFSRPPQPQLQPVRFSPLINETLDFLQGTLVQKQIQVNRVLLTDTDEVLADAAQMKQVLLNLLLNSVEAIDPPGCITVSTAQNDGYLKVVVSDTGRGISRKELSRVFDPFFTTKTGGSGLGLSVVHSIVREHHGRIHIDSEMGQGTTVTITLPTNGRNGHEPTPHTGRG